jgi:hypothetical protein
MPFCQFYPLGIALEVYLIEAITQDGDPNCYEDRGHRNSEKDVRGLIDHRIMHHVLVQHIKPAHADPDPQAYTLGNTLFVLGSSRRSGMLEDDVLRPLPEAHLP